jgi:hypothetical protein
LQKLQGKAAYKDPKWSDPSPDPAQKRELHAPGLPFMLQKMQTNHIMFVECYGTLYAFGSSKKIELMVHVHHLKFDTPQL